MQRYFAALPPATAAETLLLALLLLLVLLLGLLALLLPLFRCCAPLKPPPLSPAVIGEKGLENSSLLAAVIGVRCEEEKKPGT